MARANWRTMLAGAALAVAGVIVGTWWSGSPAPQPAFAMATHGTENLTAATGYVEGGAEGVFYLDHVTGELNGAVISTNSWKVVGRFTYGRIKDDLNLGGVRNPKFSVVTGQTSFKPLAGKRLGTCVIYVAEETQGVMCAYAIPWEAGNMSRNSPVAAEFIKLTPALKISSAVRRGTGAEPTPKEEREVPGPGTKKGKAKE